MDTCFKKLGKSPIRALVEQFIDAVTEAYGPDAWVEYYGFRALPLPDDYIELDPTLKALSEKRKFRIGVLSMPPNSSYIWHADSPRHSTINMLIRDGGDSKSLFAPNGVEYLVPIVELRYEPDTLYAFNTEIMHSVINFSQARYVLSVEFLEDDQWLTYAQLCADLS